MSDHEESPDEEYIQALIQRASSFVVKKKQTPKSQPPKVEPIPELNLDEDEMEAPAPIKKTKTKRLHTEVQIERMRENLKLAREKAMLAKQGKKKQEEPIPEPPKKKESLRKYNHPEPYKREEPSPAGLRVGLVPSEPIPEPVRQPPVQMMPIKATYFVPKLRHYMKTNNMF